MTIFQTLGKYFLIFLISIILICLVLMAIFWNRGKKTEAYQAALEYVRNDESILRITGGTEGDGYNIAYRIKKETAYITFTIKGVKKDVTVYCDLSRSGGKWKIDKLVY